MGVAPYVSYQVDWLKVGEMLVMVSACLSFWPPMQVSHEPRLTSSQ